MITWPVPDPVLPETVDPVLAEAARAATAARSLPDNRPYRRWSGVVAASPALAEELAAVIGGS
ncbi:MAG: hypothetical protein QOH87_1008 [Trebonia sp.]|jgi:hypothetical protein|nr:hypothetical protein [Trebonia sp.]MDX6418771.1 hypothetical protein [Trebonia sp.]